MYERWEIVQLYKEAQDKNKQIEILAELCVCSKEEILNILAEEGAISGVKPKMVKKDNNSLRQPVAATSLKDGGCKVSKRQSEKGKWTAERIEELQRFLDEGIAPKEIAERMGEERQAIYDAMQRYIKKKKENVKSKVQNETTLAERMRAEQNESYDKDKKILRIQNDCEDIKANAVIAKDILNMITWADEGDLERYADTVGTLCATVAEIVCEIIKISDGIIGD